MVLSLPFTLPEEVLVSRILSKLNDKELVVCRAVCTSFRAIIDTNEDLWSPHSLQAKNVFLSILKSRAEDPLLCQLKSQIKVAKQDLHSARSSLLGYMVFQICESSIFQRILSSTCRIFSFLPRCIFNCMHTIFSWTFSCIIHESSRQFCLADNLRRLRALKQEQREKIDKQHENIRALFYYHERQKYAASRKEITTIFGGEAVFDTLPVIDRMKIYPGFVDLIKIEEMHAAIMRGVDGRGMELVAIRAKRVENSEEKQRAVFVIIKVLGRPEWNCISTHILAVKNPLTAVDRATIKQFVDEKKHGNWELF